MTAKKATIKESAIRPPIVVVLGHVDHGKSTLLDYIRKTNTVDKEHGGITQHVGAYEAVYKDKTITFIDTPGHAAFSKMRGRGANVADIAVLVVAADDGVKPQTIEAYQAIESAKIPFVVAINKIDRPEANIDRAKQSLAENNIYIEGYGGTVPWVAISAKAGTGVNELLEVLELVAEMGEFKADITNPATGRIIESHRDPQSGIHATLLVTDGTLHKKDFLAVGSKVANVRTIENSSGQSVSEMLPGKPAIVTGFEEVPLPGSTFCSYKSRKDAELAASSYVDDKSVIEESSSVSEDGTEKVSIPIVVKADTLGTLEALLSEIAKLSTDKVMTKTITSGIGPVSENDIRSLRDAKSPIVIHFNVKVDKVAKDLADNINIPILSFNIIYKVTEFLGEEIKKRTPSETDNQPTGTLKILKTFSATKKKQVVGGQVQTGTLKKGNPVEIMRREAQIGIGRIVGLQQLKKEVDKIEEGDQCGLEVETKIPIASGDVLLAYSVLPKK